MPRRRAAPFAHRQVRDHSVRAHHDREALGKVDVELGHNCFERPPQLVYPARAEPVAPTRLDLLLGAESRSLPQRFPGVKRTTHSERRPRAAVAVPACLRFRPERDVPPPLQPPSMERMRAVGIPETSGRSSTVIPSPTWRSPFAHITNDVTRGA